MKIALFSDVHANLPAFQVFLANLDSHKPDAVYCLGDLIGYNVWPNEVIAGVRKRGIATIAGNHDLKLNKLAAIAPELLHASGKDYAYHLVEATHRDYLLALPAHIRLEYTLKGKPFNILLVHGSPLSVDEYLTEGLDESYVLDLLAQANADILCAGHTHLPYHRTLKRANGNIAHVINIGSVGKPKDGNPRGCYAMLNINTTTDIAEKDAIGVEFIRFDYDVERAALAVEKSPLPDEFADRLRKAY